MKKIIITLAKKFPANHRRAGEPTYFKDKIINTFLDDAGVGACDCCKYETRNCDECFNAKQQNPRTKIHTIRLNGDYWLKKHIQVCNGDAEVLLKQWKNRPYKDKQDKEFATLNKLGFQKIRLEINGQLTQTSILNPDSYKYKKIDLELLAKNDGLSKEDFINWFFGKKNKATIEAYVLHFTDFRY